MARTKAETKKVEAKALASSSKSEGMRMLFEAGYTVAEVTHVMGAPYGFVYGVAKRAGYAETAAKRRVPRIVEPKTKAKTAKVSGTTMGRELKEVKALKARQTTKRQPAKEISATQKVAAKLAAKKPGRPSAARRSDNRKPRTQAYA